MIDRLAFVHPSGVAYTKAGPVRLALGNPQVPGSLFQSPESAPWDEAALEASYPVIQTLADRAVLEQIAQAQVVRRDLIPFPYANRNLFQTTRFKGLCGGRASTKTYAIADYLLLRAAHEPLRILCTREFQNSIKQSVHDQLVSRIEALNLQSQFTILQTEIRGTNGSIFTYAGLHQNVESLKSAAELDIVWVEEAETVRPSSLSLLIPTIRKAGSELIFSWNRVSEHSPVDQLFFQSPPEESLLVQSSWLDNPWLDPIYIQDILRDRSRDPQLYEHKWGGGLQMRTDAAALTRWTVGECSEPGTRIAGLDFGFNDPTAMVVARVLSDRRLFIEAEVYGSRVSLDNLPAFLFGTDTWDTPRWENPQAYRGFPEAMDLTLVADSARPEIIEHLRTRKISVRGSKKGAGSILEGVNRLRAYDIIISPECPNFRFEAAHYQFEVDRSTDLPTDRLKDANNHLIDALRYAVEDYERTTQVQPIAGPINLSRPVSAYAG